jgi:hypothetical protein
MTDTRRDILPQEIIRPAGHGSLAALLVLIVLLVVGANFIASAVLKRLPVNRGYALAYGKWTLMDRALSAGTPVDVLIVGDSSSNQGLDPHVIEAQTGRKAMNFGVVAEGLTAIPLWTADRFLEESTRNGAPPRIILWMHVYDVWSRVDRNERRLRGISAALPPTAWPYNERGPKVRIATRDLWLMQQVPLYFQNTSLANLIRRPRASVEEANRFKFDALGFTAETVPDPALVRRDTRNHMNLVRENDFSLTALSRRSIDAMSQLAARHEAELWIVPAPHNRSLWQDPAFRERWYEVRDALKAAASRYPHVRVAFDEPMVFEDGRMQNCDHVLADAAADFTRAVIERTGLNASTQPAAGTRGE